MKSSESKTNENPSKAAANQSFGKDCISLFPPSFRLVQAKLTVNQPNDVYEQEADNVADEVMRMTSPAIQSKPLPVSSLQRKCAHCEKEEKNMQRKESNGEKATMDNLENYVGNLSSGGQPLAGETKSFYESRFGYDFSNVKIHTDPVAARSAQSINALAYTNGNNIVFNEGQYSPGTDNGKRLLAHELTHTLQQTASNTKLQRAVTNSPLIQQHGDVSQSAGIDCPIGISSPADEQRIDYGTNISDLNDTTRRVLDDFASRWNADGTGKNVRIDGYASTTGTESLNWQLSCNRAHAVENELLNPSDGGAGIPAGSLSIFAHGATNRFSTSDFLPNQTATLTSEIRVNPTPTPVPVPPPVTPPAPAPATNLKFWINAFIPSMAGCGQFRMTAGSFAGREVFAGPPHPDITPGHPGFFHSNGCFETDDRTFSTAFPVPSSRVHIPMNFDLISKTLIPPSLPVGGFTFEVDCTTGDVLCTSSVSPSGFTSANNLLGTSIITFSAAAGDPCVTGAPDLSMRGTIIINHGSRTFSVNAFTTFFPAFEMYVDDGASVRTLFTQSPAGCSPFILIVPGLNPHIASGSF